MNVKLLKKLRNHLLKSSKAQSRFNMHYYGDSTKHGNLQYQITDPVCNTQACLAGEVLLMTKKVVVDKEGGLRHKDKSIPFFFEEAAQVLDLSKEEASRLFKLGRHATISGHKWPHEFDLAYNNASTPSERTRIAADRIDHFIKTNGAE